MKFLAVALFAVMCAPAAVQADEAEDLVREFRSKGFTAYAVEDTHAWRRERNERSRIIRERENRMPETNRYEPRTRGYENDRY